MTNPKSPFGSLVLLILEFHHHRLEGDSSTFE